MFAQNFQGGRGIGGQESTWYNTDGSNEVIAGTNGNIYEDEICYGYQFRGHYRNKGPYSNWTEVMCMYIVYLLAQDKGLFDKPDL